MIHYRRCSAVNLSSLWSITASDSSPLILYFLSSADWMKLDWAAGPGDSWTSLRIKDIDEELRSFQDELFTPLDFPLSGKTDDSASTKEENKKLMTLSRLLQPRQRTAARRTTSAASIDQADIDPSTPDCFCTTPADWVSVVSSLSLFPYHQNLRISNSVGLLWPAVGRPITVRNTDWTYSYDLISYWSAQVCFWRTPRWWKIKTHKFSANYLMSCSPW